MTLRDWRYVAKCMAALSPRCPWERNIELTFRVAHGIGGGTMAAMVKKAQRCLTGQNALKGKKERSFAAAIIGNRHAACIDTHMIQAAGLSQHPKVAEFRQCQQALADLSQEVGEDTRDLQAIIWTVQRAL